MKSSAAGKEKARCRLFPKHRFQGFFTFPVVLSFLILAATKQGNAQLSTDPSSGPSQIMAGLCFPERRLR